MDGALVVAFRVVRQEHFRRVLRRNFDDELSIRVFIASYHFLYITDIIHVPFHLFSAKMFCAGEGGTQLTKYLRGGTLVEPLV